jgi:excisionase family DNA binding protein
MPSPDNPVLSAEWTADPASAHMQVVQAIKVAEGDIREAARRLGVSRPTLYRWIQERESLQTAVRGARAAKREAKRRLGASAARLGAAPDPKRLGP